MQALILAGGEGTRLRPLTSAVPKPVVPLVGRPFIAFMLDWLRGHGVDDVIMSCGFLADGVRDVLGDGNAHGVRLRYVEEPEPLGTGGALKFAEDAARRAVPDAQRGHPHRPRRRRPARAARGARRPRHAGPHARGGPERVRARAHGGGRRGHRLRGEAVAGADRHAQHLRRRLRPRAQRARPARARPPRVDRARRLPAPRRGRPLRLRRRGLLARHRDARALPAGHRGHPRRRRPHGRDGRAPR